MIMLGIIWLLFGVYIGWVGGVNYGQTENRWFLSLYGSLAVIGGLGLLIAGLLTGYY